MPKFQVCPYYNPSRCGSRLFAPRDERRLCEWEKKNAATTVVRLRTDGGAGRGPVALRRISSSRRVAPPSALIAHTSRHCRPFFSWPVSGEKKKTGSTPPEPTPLHALYKQDRVQVGILYNNNYTRAVYGYIIIRLGRKLFVYLLNE